MEVLEHEVLKTLMIGVFSVGAYGSEKEGHSVINKELIGYASLHYGTLVGLLNNPDLKPDGDMPIYYQWVLKKEDINTDKYSLREIENAVQILIMNKHVTDSAENGWLTTEKREIKITKEGHIAFITKYYEKEKKKEEVTNQINESLLSTNLILSANSIKQSNLTKWIKVAAIVSAIATSLLVMKEIVVSYELYKDKHKSNIAADKSNEKIVPKQNQKDTVVHLLNKK